jgi:hypothetical protein
MMMESASMLRWLAIHVTPLKWIMSLRLCLTIVCRLLLVVLIWVVFWVTMLLSGDKKHWMSHRSIVMCERWETWGLLFVYWISKECTGCVYYNMGKLTLLRLW